MAIAFEDFELIEASRELRRNGAPIELQPKVFDLLLFFAKNGDRLITRQELLDEVWDGVIVGDAAISRAVREVRRALSDDGEAQRIIKTVHARGFRFVAAVRAVSPAPHAAPAAARPPPAPTVPAMAAVRPDDDFIGRRAALKQLDALLADVTGGAGGRSTVVVGEPGIGKSRVLDRVARAASSRGLAVHLARCSEADGVPALWPWEQIVRSIAATLDPARASAELRRAASDIAQLLGGDGARFGADPAPSDAAADDPRARFRLQDGVARFLGEAASTRGLALLFDDIHLADHGSLSLLQDAASRVRALPVVIVATLRDRGGEVAPALLRAADALTRGGRGALRLDGFDDAEVAEFVERQTGRPPDARTCESLKSWTGGNPLFLTHVIDTLGADEEAIRSVRVPPVLRDAIDGSLVALSDDAVDVLSTAAVVGPEFRALIVAKATGRRADELLDALGEALEYRVVRRVPDRVDTFAFAHGLLRDSLYERLGLAERARRHAVVGDAIASAHAGGTGERVEELAHHYLRAASVDRADKAVEYALAAGDHASARASYEHATGLYRAALDALPLAAESAPRRAQVLMRLGTALGRAGRFDEAGSAFRHAGHADEQLHEPLFSDVKALRDSFVHIAGRAHELTARFYEILFERHPSLRALFGRRNSPAAQTQMFRDTLMAVVDHLEDAPWLRSSLAELGARHIGFNVTVEMYPLVCECLLAALSEAAGADVWTREVESAWRHALDSICAMMLEGARAKERRAS